MITIVKNLLFTDSNELPHNFIGCNAEIVGETESYYEVVFYSGIPFLINKIKFSASSVTIKSEPMNYHEVYDIHVIQNDKKISAFRTIFFEDDDLGVSAEKKALTLLKLVKGVHYDSLSLELISKEGTKINNQIKMAKKKKPGLYHIYVDRSGLPEEPVSFHENFEDEPTTEEVEKFLELNDVGYQKEYCKIEVTLIADEQKTKNKMATKKTTETGLSVFEKEATGINLPAVPTIMNIGGLEFSEEKIKKEVEEVKKLKVEIPLETDTKDVVDKKVKVYEQLKEKKNQFVKTRTAPENFRKEIVKPLADWQKKLKAQTDSFGTIAQQGQDYCEQQLAIYDNWLEEQERAEQEKKDKLVKERSQQLSDRQGVKNYDSGHWTFPYAPNLLIEQDTIETEDGWDEVLAEIDAEFEAYGAKQKQEQEKLAEGNKALVGARTMLLEMMSYKSFGDSFIKNGHVIKNDAIGNYSDEDWKALIASHNVAVESAPETKEQTPATDPFKTASSPQTGFGFGQPQQQTSGGVANPFGNPFASTADKTITVERPNEEESKLELEVMKFLSKRNIIEFTEENPFYERDLKISMLRIYHSAYREQALNIPNRDEVTKFAGKLTDNLEFIIYKK